MGGGWAELHRWKGGRLVRHAARMRIRRSVIGRRLRLFARRGLRLRIAVLLAIAILPIGAVGVWQAQELLRETRELGQTALLGLAAERAETQRAGIDAAFAALDGLIAGDTVPGPECEATLRRFVERSDAVIFAGFTTAGGTFGCRSDGGPASGPAWQVGFEPLPADENGGARVTVLDRGDTTGRPVVLVTLPVDGAAGEVGHLSLGIERDPVAALLRDARTDRDYRVSLVNAEGQPMFGEAPPDWHPVDLADRVAVGDVGTRTFYAEDATGERQLYGLATILPGSFHEISTWEGVRPHLGAQTLLATVAFPLLMWLVAFGVAYFALDRLVVLPIRRLRKDMVMFAFGDRALPSRDYSDAAAEIAELARSFGTLAEKVVADEARQAHMLDEKQVLLREIHHRVRNNLQIITSIIRMQARETEDPAGRAALTRLEERAMSISAIHGQIYESESLNRLDARRLISELAVNVLGDGGEASIGEIDAVRLDPERALCLAMIVTEVLIAVTEEEQGPETVRIHLRHESDEQVRLTIETDESSGDSHARRFSGRLIRAFAVQLDAAASRASVDGRSRFELKFTAPA